VSLLALAQSGAGGDSLVDQAINAASVAWLALAGVPEVIAHVRGAAHRCRLACRPHKSADRYWNYHHPQENDR
jgi:hypothetical protein